MPGESALAYVERKMVWQMQQEKARKDKQQKDEEKDKEEKEEKPDARPDPPEKKGGTKYSGPDQPTRAGSRADEPGANQGAEGGEPDPIGLRRRTQWLRPSDPDSPEPDEAARGPLPSLLPSLIDRLAKVYLAFRDPDPLQAGAPRGALMSALLESTRSDAISFTAGPNPRDESEFQAMDRRFTRMLTRESADEGPAGSDVDRPYEPVPGMIDPRNTIRSRTMLDAIAAVRTGRLL